jgi:hypothetical protein
MFQLWSLEVDKLKWYRVSSVFSQEDTAARVLFVLSQEDTGSGVVCPLSQSVVFCMPNVA